MTTAKIELPPKLVPAMSKPLGSYRYRALYGGRGSGKSQSVALMAAVWGYADKIRVLCTREFQVSIAESFHAELRNAIERHQWLSDHYTIGRDYITGKNGTTFLFRGLRHNSQAIKSLANIDLTIMEEAETVPEQSWLDLEATIFRRPKSELIAIWNPKLEGSPVDNRFIKDPPASAVVISLGWQDNPFFPGGLNELRLREKERLDPATYAHVWEGAYLRNSESQVFSGRYAVEEFTPAHDWEGPFCGLDFGFASDPTAAVQCWIHADTLYIEHEAGGTAMELDDTASAIGSRMPEFNRRTMFADSARPESISYLRRHGMPNIRSVKKWPGSVEDGIEHIKTYRRVVIHPRCRETAREFMLYSYKVDKYTGEVLTSIVDAHNHYIDALRYALSERIRHKPIIFEAL